MHEKDRGPGVGGIVKLDKTPKQDVPAEVQRGTYMERKEVQGGDDRDLCPRYGPGSPRSSA